MMPADAFPRLTPDNHRCTSPADSAYNYIAWSAGDTEHGWQPGMYWPSPVDPRDVSLDALVQMFRSQGYEDAGLDAHSEPAVEKVALFGSALFYTHAARQLANGKWTSKLGKAEDIEHDTPDAVGSGIYGELVRIMKRPARPAVE